jgi:hypothetical protein
MLALIHSLIFTLVFQGLAVLAFCCLLKMLMDYVAITNNYLRLLTSPIVTLTRMITPIAIPRNWHFVLAAVWLLVARVALYMCASAYGWLPVVTK